MKFGLLAGEFLLPHIIMTVFGSKFSTSILLSDGIFSMSIIQK